jgi:drug/metabolite transporter (DMT)-like permease
MQWIKMYGAIVLAMIFWSFSFIWTKIAIESFPPVTLVSLRLFLASILLFTYAKITGKFQLLRRQDLKWFLLLAFFEPFLYYMGETYGLTMIDATSASVIIATIPLFAPVLAWFLLKEKISWTNILGIIVTVSGVLLVIYQPGSNLNTDFWGITLMFLAVFAAVFYTTTLRKISLHYKTVNVILYQSLFGLLYFIPVYGLVDLPHILNLKISAKSLEALMMLTIFASVLAFVLFAWVVRKIGIAKTNVFVNLIPVFTAVFSWLILNERMNIVQWTGIIIVVSGLFVSQLNRKKKSSVNIEEITKSTEF